MEIQLGDKEKQKKLEEGTALLKALAHPVRLMVIKTLLKERCNVTSLEKLSGLSQSGVSQHLRILRLSGVIEASRDGKEICYNIVSDKAIQIVDILCK